MAYVVTVFKVPTIWAQGSVLPRQVDFNLSIDKQLHSYYIHYKAWDEITYPFPSVDDAVV